MHNKPLKFVSSSSNGGAAQQGYALAHKAREQMCIAEQQKSLRSQFLHSSSSFLEMEENEWQKHLDAWRKKRISAILNPTQQPPDPNNNRRHSISIDQPSNTCDVAPRQWMDWMAADLLQPVVKK
uniref:Uncharacterized protein n=1 Tax=Ditylenchus dipsaci TaxID=166011 RepID=A0A915CM60_9BILA